MKKFQDNLYFILGAVSGLYCLRIYNISLIFFPLIVIMMINFIKFLKKGNININIMNYYYICILISLIVGVRYDKLFYSNLKSFELIKVLVFISISLFFKLKKISIENFILGVKLTIFFNLVWGTLEFSLWRINKFLLNDYIFGKILNIDTGGHGWVYLRSSTNLGLCGFSWDPLHLGILSALGILIYKNKYLKLYSFIILLLCGSRAGLIGCVGGYILDYFFKNLRKINLKRLILNYCIIIGIILGVGLFFKYKINNNYTGDNRRKAYYISAVKSTLLKNKVDTFLFGGSPFYSGNILAKDNELAKESYLAPIMYEINWKIESDWAHILTGRGWIGFFNYLIIFIISYFRIKDKIIKKSILLYLIAGIGYYYESSLYINLILIYVNQNYKFRRKKNERNNISWRKWNKTLSSNKSDIKTDKSNI